MAIALTRRASLLGLAKGVMAAQFGLGETQLARIFPDSAAAPPMTGLLRA